MVFEAGEGKTLLRNLNQQNVLQILCAAKSMSSFMSPIIPSTDENLALTHYHKVQIDTILILKYKTNRNSLISPLVLLFKRTKRGPGHKGVIRPQAFAGFHARPVPKHIHQPQPGVTEISQYYQGV